MKPTSRFLSSDFWDDRYLTNETGWDMGEVSPPLKNYIDQLTNKDIRILIPGCGNTYEAEYFLARGFSNITVIDFAPTLVNKLKLKFQNTNIRVVLADFFEHSGTYDLILEQTFFCAIDPELRSAYCGKMHSLLSENGKLVGVLFNKHFEKEGPPFGGSGNEYDHLFKNHFEFVVFESCKNSHPKRQDVELFIVLRKK
ncbi:MAG TPA: methyltransferase domain-containing protein [Bacteroidia bacterium]